MIVSSTKQEDSWHGRAWFPLCLNLEISAPMEIRSATLSQTGNSQSIVTDFLYEDQQKDKEIIGTSSKRNLCISLLFRQLKKKLNFESSLVALAENSCTT